LSSLVKLPRVDLSARRWATFVAHLFKASVKQHHQDLIPIMTRLVPKDGVVFDVGAHAGQFAKLFARLAPQGTIYSFEPGRYARLILMFAVAVNRIANIRIFPFGLSDKPALLELSVPIKKSGSFGFGLSHLGATAEDGPRQKIDEVVELVTMDGFCAVFPITRLDLIKADIEGWELRMLVGGTATLTRFRPVLWIEAVDPHLARAGDSLAALWSFLTGLDYHPYDGKLNPLTSPIEGDILWIPAGRKI
jgi:FkbM family methyltransferase